MKIRIDPFDISSIERACRQVEEYQRKLKEKEKLLLERLADIGAERAKAIYSMAFLDFEPDIQISTEIVGNRAIIYASGEQVAFVEFGAGALLGNGYPGERPEGIVGIGEYGHGRGKSLSGWVYKDDNGDLQHTYGNAPAAAMYDATLAIAEQVTNVAREVFLSD